MSPTDFAILLVIVGVFWRFLHLCGVTARHNRPRPPPGPIGLPFIGHLHMLGKLPHRTLYKLSQKYGPIMSIRLGSVPAIVVSSPAAAELFLKTHDTVFASRPKSKAADYLSYGTKGMAFSEYGAHWRSVRKFCTLELLSPTKIDSMSRLRREELELLVESLKKAARAREVVDVSENVSRLIEAMTCRMLFGKSRDDRFELNEIIHELAELVGAFNIADYVPFLGALDLQLASELESVHLGTLKGVGVIDEVLYSSYKATIFVEFVKRGYKREMVRSANLYRDKAEWTKEKVAMSARLGAFDQRVADLEKELEASKASNEALSASIVDALDMASIKARGEAMLELKLKGVKAWDVDEEVGAYKSKMPEDYEKSYAEIQAEAEDEDMDIDTTHPNSNADNVELDTAVKSTTGDGKAVEPPIENVDQTVGGEEDQAI